MKTSLIMATLVVVGAGAVGAGATFATQPYQGSDTLYDLTNGAIAAALLGNSGDYQGGGSGAGENAMTAATPTQHTAPMSKMMTKQTCAVAGGSAAFSHASGMAIGLDAVDVYSSVNAGAVATCNGASGVGGDNTGFGLRYSGTNGGDGGSYLNWTDMLALLYGGMDKSSSFCAGGTAAGAACNPQTVPQSGTACVTGGGTCTPLTDCLSTKRQTLVAHWNNLFQSASCTGNAAGVCSATLPAIQGELPGQKTAMGGKLWHAFRRDDNSGTADVFASLLGLGQLTGTNGVKTITANVSSSANKGFGASPYCNVINWDNTAGNANCALGANHQFVGPGGIPDPAAADASHRRPPSYCTNGAQCVPNGAACADGSVCNGAWGSNPDTSQTKNNDTAAAFPTSFQDNDPIRRPCISRSTFVGNKSNPAEEVCNLDGKLGVVLPIPPVDFIPRNYPTGGNGGTARTAFNTNVCQSDTPLGTFAVYKCTQTPTAQFGQMCPNSDHVGGACQAPADVNTAPPSTATPCAAGVAGTACTTLCENNPTFWPAGAIPNQDARIFNLFVFDGGQSYSTTTVPAVPVTFAFAGAFARLHQTLPMFDPTASNCGANSDCPANNPVCQNGDGTPGDNSGTCAPHACQQGDATDQIGCLVQADPCSIGFAADGGFSWGSRALPAVASNNDRMRVNQIYPTTTTVQNGSYFFWRKVYFNSSAGFDQAALANTAELALGQYEANPTTMTGLLGTYGFFGFGHSPNASNFTGANAVNAPFCEDFNEQMIGANGGTSACNGVASNTNACNFNTTVQAPSANTSMPAATLPNSSLIPSDPSSNAATPTTSTVCGNGHKEVFEDCDDGLLNGTSGDPCSLTCRNVFL